MRNFLFKFFALAFAFTLANKMKAEDEGSLTLKQRTLEKVKNKLEPLLQKYCKDKCQIVDIEVDVKEKLNNYEELGFEGADDGKNDRSYYINNVKVDIQIDHLLTRSNRERLEIILNNHLKHVGITTQIEWIVVDIPQIGESASIADILQKHVSERLEDTVLSVIQKYCPNTCTLTSVEIEGNLITPDEAKNLSAQEYVRSESEHTYYKIENANIYITLDSKLTESEKTNILALLKARTKFIRPVRINSEIVDFPEAYSLRAKREASETNDPYGLEKLRRTLMLFRELAGTKEIISSNSKESLEEQNTDSAGKIFIFALIFLLFIGFFGIIFIRLSSAQKDAKMMVQSLGSGQQNKKNENNVESRNLESEQQNTTNFIKQSLEFSSLKQELIDSFISAPKIAKETFTRLLQEEGVEECAKIVHIFGKMIIFELLSDPALQRNLYELSEYYHKSKINLQLEQKLEILNDLKTKITANEIKILASHTLDQFDFLSKLDAAQIHKLIEDEGTQIQSIVLTQLGPKRRRGVFEMFAGQGKIELMRGLSKTDAIPKEYLFNVAAALHKKVTSKPEFDTQSLRSSDILFELLERSPLEQQRELMRNLQENNPDAARAIKLKLITVEILPYLKDGHLLELVFSMDRQDLLTFLAGSAEHIKELLLSRAPDELRESWLEDLNQVGSIDESKYAVAEMLVLRKIRHLSENGAIRIADINDIIFQDNLELQDTQDLEKEGILGQGNLVA